MGVDLSDLVAPHPARLEDFAGKVIAVDAYNTLFQFLAIIRQPDGTPLMDRQGRVTSHLSGIMYRTTNLLALGIRPVWVFDGEPHALKTVTIEERIAVRQRAEEQYATALAAGDLVTARSKAQQTSRLTKGMVEQARRLLDLLGVPSVQAPRDGEAQASVMAARGDAWAVGSQDYDALLFGAPIVVKNLALSGRRKLPRKSLYVDVQPEVIQLDEVLSACGMTREQLIDIGILVGTDFNDGVRGYGPKKALALVRKHGSLRAALHAEAIEIPNYDEVRDLFLNPEATETAQLSWRAPDAEGAVRYLCDEFDFSEERVRSATSKVSQTFERGKQRALDQWF